MGIRRSIKILMVCIITALCGCKPPTLIIKGIRSNNNSLVFRLNSNYNRYYDLHRFTIAFNDTKDYLVFSENDVKIKTGQKEIIMVIPCDSNYLKNNKSTDIKIDFGRISVIATINIEYMDDQFKFIVLEQICSRHF